MANINLKFNISLKLDEDDLINLLTNYQNSPFSDNEFEEFLEGLVEAKIYNHPKPEEVTNQIIPLLENLLESIRGIYGKQ